MLVPLLHGAGLALGLILPLGPQNVFVFSQGAVQPRLARALSVVVAASLCDTLLIMLAVLGAVEPVREVLGKVSALIMWGTALYLARQLWEAAA
jgi:L-lysine exporter family protein LysE/ArgO